MTPYHELSRAAQARSIRPPARRALAAYGLGPARLTLLQHLHNTTYRVRPARGRGRFVLRVHGPRRHCPAELRSEFLWLEALRAEGFGVPEPVRTRSGAWWTEAAAEGVPEARLCTLLRWVPGRFARRRRSPALLGRVGAFVARLHEQAKSFRPALDFARPRWDHQTLVSRRSPVAAGWGRLSAGQARLFEAVGERLRCAGERLGEGPEVFGLIHGDFNFKNLLFCRGEVRAIDFDDCGFGHFLYDLGTLLETLVFRPDYLDLWAALLGGYRRVRPLPPGQEALLDTFIAARWVHVGLVIWSRQELASARAYAPRITAIVEPNLRGFLRVSEKGEPWVPHR
jgi:Ser/Thr protein kinase RdoA (MazF antagonist)